MSENPPVASTPTDKPRWYHRRWVLITAAVLALLTIVGALAPDEKSGRGDPAPTTTTTQETPSAQLSVDSIPSDQTVRRGHLTLAGTATPGAEVTVGDKTTTATTGGGWKVPLKLELGDNEFTVSATAPGMASATTDLAIRRVRSAKERRAFVAAQARKAAARAARQRARKLAAIQAFKDSAKTIPYKQLIKDPDAQKGKRVVYRGKVFQIQQDGEYGGILLLSVTDEGYDIWDDNIWIDYDKAIGAAEDDIITVYGTLTGSKSYETQIGGETYVPRMHARYFETG